MENKWKMAMTNKAEETNRRHTGDTLRGLGGTTDIERWRTDRHRAEHTVCNYVYGGLGCPGPLLHPSQNQMNTLNLPLQLTRSTCPRELQQRGSSLRRAGTGESRDWRWGGVIKNKNLHSG